MAKISDHISKKFNATILLIPHEIPLENIDDPLSHSNKIRGDDITAVKDVYSKVKEKKRIIPIVGNYQCDTIKGIIGKCELFIGARTHSIIAAISLGTPTIGIRMSQKTPGILRMFGLENYVCDFRKISFEELQLKIEELFSRKNQVKSDLTSQLDTIEEKMLEIGKYLQAYIFENVRRKCLSE